MPGHAELPHRAVDPIVSGMMFWLGIGRGHPLHSDLFSPDERAIGATVGLIGDYLTQL
ncbi:MAG: hypothetical protein ACRDNS_09605 [Trebonia sp.]